MDLHPFAVHFPVALLAVSLAFELTGIYTKREDFSRTAWWVQIVGTAGALAAVGTGLLAQSRQTFGGEARAMLESHQQSAFAIAALFVFLLLWRISAKGRVPSSHTIPYMLLFVAGVLLLLAGAWYGGELVFRFGAGARTLP
jgi:uncharacterized membrane protein